MLLAHEVGDILQSAPYRKLERFAQTRRRSIVKEGGDPGVFQRIGQQRASQGSAELVGADDHCPIVLADRPHTGEQ